MHNFLDQQDLVYHNNFQSEGQAEEESQFDHLDVKDAFLEFISSFMLKYKKFLVIVDLGFGYPPVYPPARLHTRFLPETELFVCT